VDSASDADADNLIALAGRTTEASLSRLRRVTEFIIQVTILTLS
jgi:hypothetical protein